MPVDSAQSIQSSKITTTSAAVQTAAAAPAKAAGPKLQSGNAAAAAAQAAPGAGKVQKRHSVKEAFQKMFLEAFQKQNPGVTEVPLRGQIYFQVKDGKLQMAVPADGKKLSAAEVAELRTKGLRLSWMYESEGKLTTPQQIKNNRDGGGLDKGSFDAINKKLLDAVKSGDLTEVVGKKIAKELKAEGWKLVKNEKDRDARPFSDMYYDDKDGTLTGLDITLRMRQVDDEIGTKTGRFTAKILQGNEGGLWARGEIKFTAGDAFPVGDFFIPGKVPDLINPIMYLKSAYPEIDVNSLAPMVLIRDMRHEFNVEKDPKPGEKYGDSLYLVTLDKVNPADPNTGKSGHYFEIENERIAPPENVAQEVAQRQFMEALKKNLGLVASPMNKAETGFVVVKNLPDSKKIDHDE
jgi:hypothetical protein